MDPINYLAQVPQYDFGKTFFNGLQAGAAVGQLAQQQQAQQLAQQQAQQYKADVTSALASPTPQNFSALALKYPTQREAIKQSWDGLSAADQKQEGDTMAQAYSALLAGRPDVAKQVVQTQVDARKNAGLDTAHYDNALSLLDSDPKQAQGALGFALSHIADPKDFAAKFGTLQELPGKVAEQDATTAGKVDDNTLKGQQITAQKAGALAKVVKSPDQVQAFLQSEAKAGRIAPDDLATLRATVPTDPAALPGFLNSIMTSGIKPDDQQKYLAPTADAKLSADTQVQTTGMNNATSITTTRMNNDAQRDVQKAIAERQDAKGDTEPTLDADTLSTMAQQYLAGDKSVMQNLGRGAQGAANIVALRQAITKEAKTQGMTGPQIAAKMADYQGMTAGLRTSANISARVENAISEAKELAPLAIAAGREVSRSGFLPFGKATVMFDTQTNNPALKKFATANTGLVSAYAGAMARGQKPTQSMYDHAHDLLATAQSQEAYEATVNQMFAEMAAASKAPQNVREHLRGEIGGGHSAAPAVAAPTLPSGWSVEVH